MPRPLRFVPTAALVVPDACLGGRKGAALKKARFAG